MSVAIALHQKDLSTITILSSNLTLSISFWEKPETEYIEILHELKDALCVSIVVLWI